MCKNAEIDKLNNWKIQLEKELKKETNNIKTFDLFVTIANINKQIKKINMMM